MSSSFPPQFRTFPDLLDPSNPLNSTADQSRRILSSFHTNQALAAKERQLLLEDLHRQGQAVNLFEKQCYQSLKNLHIVDQMLAPRIPTRATLQAEIAGLGQDLEILKRQSEELHADYQSLSSSTEDSRGIVEEWDAARFLLTEVNFHNDVLREKCPEMLNLFFRPQDVLGQDPHLRLRLGIPTEIDGPYGGGKPLHSGDALGAGVGAMGTPSQRAARQAGLGLGHASGSGVGGDEGGGAGAGTGAGAGQQQQQQANALPPLTDEQLDLYKMDSLDKRNLVLAAQQRIMQGFRHEASTLDSELEFKTAVCQRNAEHIRALKQKIAQHQAYLEGSAMEPGSAAAATTATLATAPGAGGGKNGKKHGRNGPSEANGPSARPNAAQLILDKLTNHLDQYKAHSGFLQASNHFEVDVASLDSHNFISFRFRSIALPSGRFTSSGKLVLYRFPPNAPIPPTMTQSLPWLTGVAGQATNQRNTAGSGQSGPNSSNVVIAPLNSFIVSGAKFFVQEHDHSAKIDHLVQEAIETQHLGLLVAEVQSLLAL